MFKKKKNKLKNIFLELLTLVSQNKISKVQEKKNVNDNIASYFSELDFSCITDLLQWFQKPITLSEKKEVLQYF